MNDGEIVEVIKEFLIESNENLARLELEMVDLEKRPGDAALLGSIFRAIHTIKGTCGFLGFQQLEKIAHAAESLLNQLRNGERRLTPALVSVILDAVDAIKTILATIEATGREGDHGGAELIQRLLRATETPDEAAAAAPAKAESGPRAVPAPADVQESTPGNGNSDAEQARSSSIADSTIRVDVALLDNLMNLVGELVLARNHILQFNSQSEHAGLNTTSQRLNLITTQLQEGVMKTRMQPIGIVWNKVPRLVRDLASNCGKQILLEMDGAETELDKSIIEAIKDPLTHIVRNCCDHGIETPEVRVAAGKPIEGRLTLRAFHEGGQVNIEVGDDGGGIDVARLKDKAIQKGVLRPEQAERLSEREALLLVFHPGLSTAREVTNISGRGVGMDVVKTNIEKIGGIVDVVSRAGEGTTVKLKIPLTLAIIPGLVVDCGGERFVIPQVSLLELVRLEGDAGHKQIELIHGTPVFRRRGSLLPLAYLSGVLGLPRTTDSGTTSIVVLQAEARQFGLVVDTVHDTQEIVVKPLGKQLKGLNAYAGATIMGDGRVSLILDVLGLGMLSGVLSHGEKQDMEDKRPDTERRESGGADRRTVLVFKAGAFERLAVPLSTVARLEEFPRAKVERAGGRDVVQYRDTILPLVPMASVLEPDKPAGELHDPVQAVVFRDGDRMLGLVVDHVVDILDDQVTMRQPTPRPGLAGSAVMGGKVTDFVDLHAVVQAAGMRWCEDRATRRTATVLVAEGSAFSRGLFRNYLELAGYRVVDAASGQDALEQLERGGIDVLVAALDLPPRGGQDLIKTVRSRPRLAALPALAVSSGDMKPGDAPRSGGFDAFQVRGDRQGMLRAIEDLLDRRSVEAAVA
jgi:two-component system chemotaxis sensor kinase CheA